MKSRNRGLSCSGLRCRSSIRLCKQRLACKGVKPVAVYFCDDCDTFQCHLCEALLHETKFKLHVRQTISQISQELLCDGDCADKNFADVSCSTCRSKFCHLCDRVAHSQKSKKTHVRSRFIPDLDEFLSCEDFSSGSDSERAEDELQMLTMSSLEDYADPLQEPSIKSFALISEKEQLLVKDCSDFIEKLTCDKNKPVKVLSIFGNTGDGKSYTLNHAFFQGASIFKTSSLQSSCTAGVWAAYCSSLNAIIIDTEGFLGQSSNANNRSRMLLKILAISDIVVYRTRAERLHNDLFSFIGDASVAYTRHFSQELKQASSRCNINGPLSLLGPAVIIFHETHHTQPLSNDAEETLRSRFQELDLKIDAFSSLEYIGVKSNDQPTDFQQFREGVEKHIKNLAVRLPRSPPVVFEMLKILSDKFSGALDKDVPNMFPDEYFTCPYKCLSCKSRCSNSMNHTKQGIPHSSVDSCIYQHQFDNRMFFCKKCCDCGQKVVVTPQVTETNDSLLSGLLKYAWKGYLLECPRCGVIYRSRQYWYGNKDPWETCVQTEISHVWLDSADELLVANTAQYVLDSLNSLSEIASNLSAKPTKAVTSWMADQVAPSYWVPNSEIKCCGICNHVFEEVETKHHCRICGGGFCDMCSSEKLLISTWGSNPVRVCKKCFEENAKRSVEEEQPNPPTEVTARKISEFVTNTLSTVISYPVGIIKDKIRPAYWVPDDELTNCKGCNEKFTPTLTIHHCRGCGEGFCNDCSANRKPVPSKGWGYSVRVCNKCFEVPE